MFANKLKVNHEWWNLLLVTLIMVQSGQFFWLLQQSIQTDAEKDQKLKSK